MIIMMIQSSLPQTDARNLIQIQDYFRFYFFFAIADISSLLMFVVVVVVFFLSRRHFPYFGVQLSSSSLPSSA